MEDHFRRDISYIEYEVLNKHKNSTIRNSVTGIHTCGHYCLNIIGAGIVNSMKDEEEDHGYVFRLTEVPYQNIKWIYDHGLWNSNYDTNHNNTIRNIVKYFFKEYEKRKI
jgi:hypothetical protein